MKWSLFACIVAVAIVGCVAAGRDKVTARTDCDLVKAIEAATLDPDPTVRWGAVYLLGLRGYGENIPAVGKLLEDPDDHVRQRAIEAVGFLGFRCGEHRHLAAKYLSTALRDAVPLNRHMALQQLTYGQGLSANQLDALRTYLEEDDADVQVVVAFLVPTGVEDSLEKRVVELIDKHAGGSMDRLLAGLLDSVHDRKNLGAVEKLLQSDNASARYHALRAKARIDTGVGEPDEQTLLEQDFDAETYRASHALQQMQWEPVQRSEVLQKVKQARLVLYGEMHETGGALRDAQMEVLRAFVRDPAYDAVGFEPSVESDQRPVLDLAESLGLKVIPLETNWRELLAAGRTGARELETISAIESFLGESPGHRMLVLRGEGHCQPDGYLARRLSVKPLILHSVTPVPLCIGGLYCVGSVFRLGGPEGIYVLPYNDEMDVPGVAALARWLAVR